MRYIHPRVIMIVPADSRPMIGQITFFISAPFDWWYFCILPLIELVELVSTNPISVIVGLRELIELFELVSINPISAKVELRGLIEFVEPVLTNSFSAKVELRELIELFEPVLTNPISDIVGVRELVELSLTEFNSAIAKLKKLVEFVPVVPAPAIVELRVTDLQLIPEDFMEQSRGNFNS